MKQRLYWGLVSTLMLLVILAFASFAEVIAAWTAFTNAKDAFEIAQGVVNVLTGEKETLEGKEAQRLAEWEEAVAYYIPEYEKQGRLHLQVSDAKKRVQDAHGVVSNCEYQIETAERGISYYQRRLDGTVSGSEASHLRANLEYWRQQKSYWKSQLSTAQTTLTSEKYTLAMLEMDLVRQEMRVYSLQMAVSSAWRRYHTAKRFLANKVAALEEKQAELDVKVSELQTAIGNLQSALANLSTRMDANEQLDAEQQQQIDSMRSDIDRILEHLGLE